MSNILTYLTNLRLSLTQYGLLMASLIIGALVTALRLQGSRLHSAQITLLTEHLNNTQNLADAKVDAAKARFKTALEAYNASK